MKKTIVIILLFGVLASTPAVWAKGDHRIGVGANYWVALKDIELEDEKLDDDGLAFLASYQYWPSLVGLELDLEFLPDRFGESALAPEAFILFGRSIYGGIGIGITYSDDDFSEEPFYALRAGLNLEILPILYLDISGNYRFNDSEELKDDKTDIDTDTVFFGATVRLAL